MNPLCECAAAGFCQRHQMDKDQRLWLCCRGEASSLDCGRKQWRAWELGLLGATATEDPQPDIEWECGQVALPFPSGTRLVRPSKQRGEVFDQTKGQVGQRVKKLLKDKYRIAARSNCQCNASAAKMDAMGCDGCEAAFSECVDMLVSGAAERWWLRPVVALFGGETRAAAENLLREAIEIERERVSS